MSHQSHKGTLFWGNILCNQLTLLSWHQEHRNNYPYLDESVNDAVFIRPNPRAFQCLMHFLFSTLDPTEASEKFHGLWPLSPGDKKAESQFRSTVFKWLSRLQKGEGTSCVSVKKATLVNEANAEAMRLGPVLLHLRLNSSHFVSPVGEAPTVLVAKFATLVAQVVAIRKYGAHTLDFTSIQSERLKGNEDRRSKRRNEVARVRVLASNAEVSGSFERCLDEAMQLQEVGEKTSNIYERERAIDDDLETRVGMISIVSDESLTALESLCASLKKMRSFHQEMISKPPTYNLTPEEKATLCLSVEFFSSLGNYDVTFPEVDDIKTMLQEGRPIFDEVLTLCEKGWKLFQSNIEKRTIDETKLGDLQKLLQNVNDRTSHCSRDLNEFDRSIRGSYSVMSKSRKRRAPPTPLVSSNESPVDDESTALPSADQVSTYLRRRLGLGLGLDKRQTLAALHSDAFLNLDYDERNDDKNASHELATDKTSDEARSLTSNVPSSVVVTNDRRSESSLPAPEDSSGIRLDPRFEEDDGEGEDTNMEGDDNDDNDDDDEKENYREFTKDSTMPSLLEFSPLTYSDQRCSIVSRYQPIVGNDGGSFPPLGYDDVNDADRDDADITDGPVKDSSFSSSLLCNGFSEKHYLRFNDDSPSSASAALPHILPQLTLPVSNNDTMINKNATNVARRWSSLGAHDDDGLEFVSPLLLDDSCTGFPYDPSQ